MFNHYTLSIFTENSPGVLQRITVLFTRRKLNIESLTVSETERKGVSRFTIMVETDCETIRKVHSQISRVVEVLNVTLHENNQLLYKEIAFFKLNASTPEKRAQIEELSRRYGAQMVHANNSALVLEKTGSEEEVNSLYLLLEPFGIKEFVRSGRIALAKELNS